MDASDGETLDPQDWEALAETFHAASDLGIAYLRDARDRPVWRPTPDAVKEWLREPAPREGRPVDALVADFRERILPYATGNTHPRFWGWVHGSGNAASVLGEMLAAFMDCNAGGRDDVATYVEREVIGWFRELFGFPLASSGILTSGTSMGTVTALAVARNARAGADVRRLGVAGVPQPLTFYASNEAHGSVQKALELLGVGSEALRRVPVNADYRMDVAALADAIAADRAAGRQPIAVVATAGTVNTGATDDLGAVADLCAAERLWMHVDGAFGALTMLAPAYRDRLNGVERADSLALDFHKWLHVTYDAGCVLVRDEAAHCATFAGRREYLAPAARGLAGGDLWYCDYGPELSRGFRALKVWFTVQANGLDRLGEAIARNCRQAAYLAERIAAEPALELLAPAPLNIVCFQYRAADLPREAANSLNSEIVAELQVRGIAAPSTTTLQDRTAIRVCITNHRTRTEDLNLLIEQVLRIGRELRGA